MEREKLDLQDYLAILRRRAWAFIVPSVLIAALAVPIIFILPPSYRSTATVLIEDQAIPRDLVRATVSSFATERLEVITQRVMATANLVELINKLDLYQDRRSRETMTELAERVRKGFKMKLIEATVVAGQTKTAIAFTLSFQHRSPPKALAVANELVSLYVSENLRTRRQNAEETKKFLEQEARKATDQISALEMALARFKEENAGILPEQVKMILGAVDRAEQQVLAVQRRTDVLKERKIYLEAQLVQVEPYLRTPAGANRDDLSPEERLRKLRSELLRLRARYGDGHPDVNRLVRQIDLLSKEVLKESQKRGDDLAQTKRDLAAAREELAEAQRKYAEAHPDVVRAQKRVAVLEKAVRDAGPEGAVEEAKGQHNPAYIKLKADLAATETELNSLADQEKALRRQITALEAQASKAPQVEREYALLQRNLEAAIGTQRELSAKLRQAQLGEALELERKGERFSLIEPASEAKEPASPNRPAFILVALVFALAMGGASAAGFEAADKSIRNPRQLAAVTGAAPLVVIPNLAGPIQRQRRRQRRLALVALLAGLLAVAAYLIVVEEVLGPLDVLSARIGNKIDLWLSDLGVN